MWNKAKLAAEVVERQQINTDLCAYIEFVIGVLGE